MDCLGKLVEIKKKSVSDYRLLKYRTVAKALRQLAGADLDVALKGSKGAEAIAKAIERSRFSAWYKKDLRIMLKTLWKLANGYDLEDRPKEIRWLSTNIKRKDKKMPKNLLTDEDLQKMMKTQNVRNRAILLTLYESGMRNSELCALKKSDVEFFPDGARINVPEGLKTGPRRLLVIDAEPLLAAWLSAHPLKGADAPLFTVQHGTKIKPLNKFAVIKVIKEAAKAAKLDKRIYPHLFRHSAASKMAKFLTDSQLKNYFGWTQDSSMAATYIHISGKDVDDAVKVGHGKPVDKGAMEDKLLPRMCSRCAKQNAHDAKLCQYCGKSFDKEKAVSDMLSLQQELAELREKVAAQDETIAENTEWLKGFEGIELVEGARLRKVKAKK